MLKKILSALILCVSLIASLSPVNAHAAYTGPEYFSFYEDGKYGYMDFDGNVVIAPQWDSASLILNNVALVSITLDDGSEHEGIIDIYGDYVLPLCSSRYYVQDIEDGNVWILKYDKDGLATDYIYFRETRCLSDGWCDFSWYCADDRLWVCDDMGNHGYIDSHGKTVITLRFYEAFDFSEGMALVYWKDENNNRMDGFIDIYGDIVFSYDPERYYCLSTSCLKEGRIMFYDRELEGYGYWDSMGQVVIDVLDENNECRFWRVNPFSEGRAVVNYKGVRGYINTDGEYLFGSELWEKAHDFINGRAMIEMKDHTFKYIDQDGNYINDESYTDATYFYPEGVAFVSKDDDNYAMLDRNGNLLIEYRWSVENRSSEQYGMGFYSEWGMWTVIDPNTHKCGLIDAKGNIIIEPIHDYITVSDGGRIFTLINYEDWQYWDLSGNALSMSQ